MQSVTSLITNLFKYWLIHICTLEVIMHMEDDSMHDSVLAGEITAHTVMSTKHPVASDQGM